MNYIKKEFTIYKSAFDLNEVWDNIADQNIFLKRDFLQFLEKVNPCSQEYHICESRKIIFVSYKLKIDALSFKKDKSFKLALKIIGVPLSVSCQGFVCPNSEMDYFINYVNSFPLILILNTTDKLDLPSTNTLSTYELDINSKNFDDYLNSLKSYKRRRLKKALEKGKSLVIRKLKSEDFSIKHLELYNQVYNRSQGRLEKLNLEYFRKMNAELYEISVDEKIIAFFQIKQVDEQMVFLFCGIDIKSNLQYDTYLNLLLFMIDLSIKRNIKKLHLGQTTSYSKTRTGATEKMRYMSVGGYIIPKKIVQYILNLLGNN